METVKVQTWNPNVVKTIRRKRRSRLPFPVVALMNGAMIAMTTAASAYIYHQYIANRNQSPMVIAEVIDQPRPPKTSRPIPRVAPIAPADVESSPEPIDMSKPQRREPRPIAPLLEAKPPEVIAATVIVDVLSGRQVVDLPGESESLRIARIEGFPGRPIVSPYDGNLASSVDIQPLSDRVVYLQLSTRGDRLSIETKSALPQFNGRLSIDRVVRIRDESIKRFEVASARKAAILAEINAIDVFLKDGQPKRLSVYNQNETQKTILRTNLEVVEVAFDQAKADMTQANRVYSAITEHLPQMRLVIVRNIPTE